MKLTQLIRVKTDQVEDKEEDGEDDQEDVVHLRPELLLPGVFGLQLLVGQLLAEPLPLQATLFLLPQEPEKVNPSKSQYCWGAQ